MVDTVTSKPARWLALIGVLGAMLIAALAGPAPKANAGWSPYCGNQTLGGYGLCSGTQRWMIQAYGYGLDRGVCVWGSLTNNGPALGSYSGCTTAVNTGVYSPAYWENLYLFPVIANNSNVNNKVVGVAITQ